MSTVSATREIPVAASEVFDLLSNPNRHAESDGSGSVRSADRGDRLQKVGDTFRMNMSGPDGDYQTANTVFALVPDRVIGWQNTRNVTKDVEVGAKWLYELEPGDADTTTVTLTYDPTEIESKAVQGVAKKFDADHLEKSLAALAEALA